MKRSAILWLAAAGFGLAAQSFAQTPTGPNGPNGPSPNTNDTMFGASVSQRTFTVTGTVVRLVKDQLTLRIDDGRHVIPFDLAPGADRSARPGSHAAVTYHPTGATGQTADLVRAQ